jgi:hypothetical protein
MSLEKLLAVHCAVEWMVSHSLAESTVMLLRFCSSVVRSDEGLVQHKDRSQTLDGVRRDGVVRLSMVENGDLAGFIAKMFKVE